VVITDLNTKLGQLLVIGFQGYTASEHLSKILNIVQPGGIILFEHNIKNKQQVKALNKNIYSLVKIKPFITCDQEGGSVERLRKICTSTASPWGLAKCSEKALLDSQKIIATELLELGFNMTLAPALDINTNKANPIINTRALSNKPEIVSALGEKIIKLYLKYNLVPVAKHFPGHGDLKVDSHLSLPILNKSKAKLYKLEFIPFIKAIKNKVPIVMVSHIQLPQIEKDKKVSASISGKIIKDILQKELKFKGLIITDDLAMKGITKYNSIENAAYKAILAGADMVLINSDEKMILKVFNALLEKSKKNLTLRNRINESYKKILFTKQKYLNHKVKISIAHNKTLSHKITQGVVHWIKKDLFFNPVLKHETIDIIYPTTPKLQLSDLKAICKELSLQKVNFIPYNINPKGSDIANVLKKLNNKTRKVVISYNAYAWTGQKVLLNKILDLYHDIIVISSGLEFDLELAPRIKNFIAAYATNYVSLLVAFEKLSLKIKSR